MTADKVIGFLTQTELRLWHMIAAFLASQLISYWVSRRSEYRQDYRNQFSDFIESTVPFELSVRSLTADTAAVHRTGAVFSAFQEGLDRQIVAARKLVVYSGFRKRNLLRDFIDDLTEIKNITKSGISANDFAIFSSAVQDAILKRDNILR